ncbi:hypothetical protein EGW08_020801 [Elysia chlorotica]|uniref:SMB domain-containing protein n=1 Tax=Elysia chlorotica TaxID=188477 RepID=A0A433SQA7_ELYCH|nr:hypothetical protein EGW08_020801 [Elysia chlorotica]
MDVCGAPTPEDYIRSNAARYTCLNRCGQVPPFGNPQLECACDAKCLIHDDCCTDIADVCPYIYTAGKRTYSHLGRLSTICHGGDFVAYSTCANLSAEHSPWNESARENEQEPSGPPFEPRRLVHYSRRFDSFRVADLFLQVVFNSWRTYEACRLPESQALFIPVSTRLDCGAAPPWLKSSDAPSVGELLKWCKVAKAKDASVRLDRACPVDTTFSCRCGSVHRELLHNACLGTNRSSSVIAMYTIDRFSNIIHTWMEHPLPDSSQQCAVVNISYAVEDDDTPSGPDSSIQMHITPVRLPFTSVKSGISAHLNIVFDVEFTHAAEKRMRCSSLDNFLSECQLTECSQSALLTRSAQSEHRYGGLSCVVPDRADVFMGEEDQPVPVCTCLRALSTFSSLGQWSAKGMNHTGGLCSFQVTKGNASTASTPEPDWPAEIVLAEADDTTTHRESRPPLKLRDKFLKLWLTSDNLCPPGEEKAPITLNLYSTQLLESRKRRGADADANEEPILSIVLSGHMKLQSSTSKGSRFIFIIALFVLIVLPYVSIF